METDDLQDIVFSIARADDIYFAARQSGLYRSEDGGQTWELLQISQDSISVTAIALAPNFGSIPYIFAGIKGGVVYSEDGGVRWTVIEMSEATIVSSIVISEHFATDGKAFVATTTEGIYCISNWGKACQRWNFGLLDRQILCMALVRDKVAHQTLWAGTSSGIFRSTNLGNSWQEVPFPMIHAPVLSLMVSPEHIIYVGTENHGVYYTLDNGQNWVFAGRAFLGAINSIAMTTAKRVVAVSEHEISTLVDIDNDWDILDIPIPQGVYPTCVSSAGDETSVLVGYSNGAIMSITPAFGPYVRVR